MTPNVWLVRAGHGAQHVDDFLRRGVMTLGWARIHALEDLRQHSDEEILQLLAAAGRGQPAADLQELTSFRDAPTGDLVVSVDSRARDLVFGQIAGPYHYASAPVCGDHRHVRDVQWRARCSRDDVPHELARAPRHYQRTVLLLPHQDEWRAFAHRILRGAGRPADAPADAP